MGRPHLDDQDFTVNDLDATTEALDEKNELIKQQAERYAMLAIKLARTDEWKLVRDLFIEEILATDVGAVRWAQLKGVNVDEIGSRVIIADEVRYHLERILSNIEGLVARGVEIQTGEKLDDLEKAKKNEAK